MYREEIREGASWAPLQDNSIILSSIKLELVLSGGESVNNISGLKLLTRCQVPQ